MNKSNIINRVTVLLFMGSLLLPLTSRADIDHQTGNFSYDVTDILVQTVGGRVAVMRIWQNDGWGFNRNQVPLRLQYGMIDASQDALDITEIEHNGETYKRRGDQSTEITLPGGGAGYHKRTTYFAEGLNNQWFVREGDVSGTGPNVEAERLLPIRWEDRSGRWAIYVNSDENTSTARLDHYGDNTGVTAHFIYDDQQRLLRIEDRDNQPVLTYAYNANGQLFEIRDGSDRRVEYHYTDGLLSEVIDVRGNATRYTYQNGKLASITDQEHRITEVAYGNTGRVSSETLIAPDGSRAVTAYRYDYDRTRKEVYVQVRNPNGRVIEEWYDKDTNLIRKVDNGSEVFSQSIDTSTKRYLERDQRGLETIKQYDEWYNLIQKTHPDGSIQKTTYVPATSRVLEKTDELGRVTQYSYNAEGNLVQRIEAVGSDVERTTQYRYNANGLLVEKKRLGDSETQESVTTFGYDPSGNLNQITDPESGVTRLTHNIWGGVQSRTDPNNQTWTYTYDNAGNRLSVTDPLERTVRMTYDGVGNRVSVTDARENTIRFTYNARNQKTSITDPQNHVTRLYYDLAGQLIKTSDALDNGQQIDYDLSGRIVSQLDAAGNQTRFGYGERGGEGGGATGLVNYPGQLNRLQYPTYLQTYDYDTRNRRTRIIDHLESGAVITTTRFDAVGNTIATRDAEERETNYRYDALNRLVEIIDPANQSTRFRYDNRDNLIEVTDPNNHTTRYTYDRADRKTGEIRPGGQRISYTYDPAGNLTSTTDPDGRRTVNSYDGANQLIRQDHFAPGVTESERTVSYTYDPNGNLTGWSDATISATLTYDENNRKTQETVNYGSFALTHRYTYDSAGNKQSYTGPDGITVTYHRSQDQLSRVELPDEGNITFNSYRWNRPSKITYPGGSARETEYDNLLRPTRIQTLDPGENSLLDYRYGYDATGNILEKATQSKTYAYDYDLLQRLSDVVATVQSEIGEPQTETEGWGYDPNGNRTSDDRNPGSWSYDANDRLTASPGVAYTYDAAGHMTSKTTEGVTHTYRYNAESRLSRIEDADQNLIAEYRYDPLGRRIQKRTLFETRYFHYSDEGLAGEVDEVGNVIRVYGYLPDSTWTTDPVYQKTGEGYAYYQNDHLGTPQQLVRKNGAKVWEGEYRAFGELVSESGDWENRLRFPGQYADGETGSYYNYFRDYDPSTGRYIEPDPLGNNGGLNSYGYVNGNSLVYYDNYGLAKIRGRFAGINIQNVDVTSAEYTENPFFGDTGVGDGDAMTMGWVSWEADVDAGLRIICAEFDVDCTGKEFIKRSWYPISGMSLYGLSGNFAVDYSPLTAIRGLLGPKGLAYSIAAARAAKEANKRIKDSLNNKYGSLNAFATAVCIATASLPEK